MEVVVETPKWSFVKYRLRDGAYEADMWSPLPTPFNYGFVRGTLGADGLPKDAIVLGRRLSRGEVVEAVDVGIVHFTDDGVEDDKVVTSLAGKIGFHDRVAIQLFFTVYALYKRFHYLLGERRLARCRFGGCVLRASMASRR